MEPKQFIEQFQDYLAPKLDTYEQALYLYIFRHGRLLGTDEVVIGFKSARRRMACGIGQDGSPMSENTAYEKLRSLQSKGYIVIVSSERTGRRIRLRLPDEIPGIIPPPATQAPPLSIEEMDFFEIEENRALILEREKAVIGTWWRRVGSATTERMTRPPRTTCGRCTASRFSAPLSYRTGWRNSVGLGMES
jgi:hypothetical protein